MHTILFLAESPTFLFLVILFVALASMSIFFIPYIIRGATAEIKRGDPPFLPALFAGISSVTLFCMPILVTILCYKII